MSTDTELEAFIGEAFALIKEPTRPKAEGARVAHPLLTDRCPSIPTLEKIARGNGTLKQFVHTNTCAYCLKSLAMYRDLLDIKPWWEELGEAVRLLVRTPLVVPVEAGSDSASSGRSVQAKVLLDDVASKSVEINVRQCRLTEKGELRMLLQLEQPIEEIGSQPVELMVVAGVDCCHSFGPYLLPGLNTGQKERVLVLLPPGLQEEWHRMDLETTRTLPFHFVLRPSNITEASG